MSVDPRTIAPLVSLGATWAVKRGMTKIYQKRTGHDAPGYNDLDTPLRTVLLWAGMTAVVTTVVDVLIHRGAATLAARQQAELEE